MAYLVDGHNLIAKMTGISLQDFDDESQLIARLLVFCRRRRKRIEVFFDKAPPGGTSVQSHGLLTVRFVRAGRTADQAIQQRLRNLGGEARNWTVVSSDRFVRLAAQAAHARHLTSKEFARMVQDALREDDDSPGEKPHLKDGMSEDEIEEWLRMYGGEPEDKKSG